MMEVCKVTSHEKNKNKNKKSYYKATRKLEKNREKNGCTIRICNFPAINDFNPYIGFSTMFIPNSHS